jgi:methionine-S-sulfoxide reductase
VGYTGGSTPSPTYRNLGDHTETLQVDYDPSKISYARLLEVFWQSHDPRRESWSRQYMAAVFYADDAQRRAAEKSKQAVAATGGGKVHTRILPLGKFHRAEDYHQKYYLRQNTFLLRNFKAIYPDPNDFTDSTAAARANGYLGGHAPIEKVRASLDGLGLSPAGNQRLLEAAER